MNFVLFLKKSFYSNCPFKVHKLKSRSDDEQTNFQPRKTKSRIINYTEQKSKEGTQGGKCPRRAIHFN